MLFEGATQMNTIFKIAAAATLAMGLASAAQAQPAQPFAGVVIVPASAPPTAQVDISQDPSLPGFKRAKIVAYASDLKPGSIIVDTRENKLYFILGMDRAAMYRVATARPGFEWSGTNKVSNKVEWPDWRPPVAMQARRPELPEFMAGGPKNPLGARAMYLGATEYRIHGTNEPKSIGHSESSGCIRMLNADVEELYQFVKIGTVVKVM
ncbi:MAG: L,D-transpeptidase [Alphaproteobacteria bacterium]|nr:L,D-transpeptidase [Alphaproteobacteria bacterium]